MSGEEIIIRREGRAGRITLNRPQALNALTYGMVKAIDAALKDWEGDASIDLVVIDGTGDKAFCAGGDVQDLYWAAKQGDFEAGRDFWRDEYPLNARIARYPKPYVALMDGIDMGGGVGVSVHGSHRIVTERTMVALPECAIGLIPDVGSSYVLARAPGPSWRVSRADRLSDERSRCDLLRMLPILSCPPTGLRR
jgi:enoyl-CoA hydratase